MKRYFQVVVATAVAVTAACASPNGVPSSVSPTSGASALLSRPNDYGNIRWNKSSVHVYKSKRSASATLAFWARDGYFTYPIACQNGGNIVATPGTVHGNPKRYDYVKYTFVAKTAKADTCGFTAVLNNTGSPPLTTLTLYVNS
jgi:hypothetical protein